MNGDEKESLKYFQMSYEVRKSLVGDNHAIVSDSLFNMAGVCAKLGLYNDSVFYYEKCLKIRRDAFGDNILVAKIYNDLAIVHTKSRNYHLAINCFKEELRILHSVLPDSEKLAAVHYNIGNIYACRQANNTAIECYRESMRIYRNVLGADSSMIANITDKIKVLDGVKIDVDNNKEVVTEAATDH